MHFIHWGVSWFTNILWTLSISAPLNCVARKRHAYYRFIRASFAAPFQVLLGADSVVSGQQTVWIRTNTIITSRKPKAHEVGMCCGQIGRWPEMSIFALRNLRTISHTSFWPTPLIKRISWRCTQAAKFIDDIWHSMRAVVRNGTLPLCKNLLEGLCRSWSSALYLAMFRWLINNEEVWSHIQKRSVRPARFEPLDRHASRMPKLDCVRSS